MATPKEELLVEISSTFGMIIIIFNFFLKKIHGHIFKKKKNFKYGKKNFTNFSRLLN
jgi:hypothetical protein